MRLKTARGQLRAVTAVKLLLGLLGNGPLLVGGGWLLCLAQAGRWVWILGPLGWLALVSGSAGLALSWYRTLATYRRIISSPFFWLCEIECAVEALANDKVQAQPAAHGGSK